MEKPQPWRIADQHEFDLSLSTMIKLGGVTDFDMTITGTAVITVLATDRGKTSLNLRLGKPNLTNRAGRHQQELESAMADLAQAQCFFDLDSGRLLELRFPQVSLMAGNTLRQIASVFQVAPGTLAREAEEFDTTGKYLASYGASTPDGGQAKHKIRYIGLLNQETDAPVQFVPRIIAGQGTVRVSPSGLLEESVWQEEVHLEGAQVAVRSVQSHRVQRTSSKSNVVVDALLVARDSMPALGAGKSLGSSLKPGALDRERIRGLPFRAVMSELEDKARRSATGKTREMPAVGKDRETEAARRGKLYSALAAHLRLDERNVMAVVEAVRRHSPASPDLIAALGSAGTAETHAGLGRLLEEGALGELDDRALQAVARTQHPDARTIAIMHAVLAKDPYNERALYALGSYSRLFRDNGQSQTAETLGEELVKKLGEAPGATSRTVTLRAIANSGYDGALGKVEPFLASPNQDIRATALRAVQSMRDPRVDGLIASGMTAEKSAVARLSAIESASLRPPSDTLVSALVAVSFVDSEPRVRYRAIEVMAKWLPQRADIRTPLERAAKKDLEQRIRELATAALAKPNEASSAAGRLP